MNTQAFPPAVANLLLPERLQALGPGTPNEQARPLLKALGVDALFAAAKVRNKDLAKACLAGLWLYHDFLDEAHKLSQDLETAEGNYWHGIVHRREPDYANAKYWFRRVGSHPVYPPLHDSSRLLARRCAGIERSGLWQKLLDAPSWDPFAFVDLCEQAAQRGEEEALLCRRIQQCEWELLFNHGYQTAVGAGET